MICAITMLFYAGRILIGLLLGGIARLPVLNSHSGLRRAAASAALRVMPAILRGSLATALAVSVGAVGAGGASAAQAGVGTQAVSGVAMTGVPTLDRLPVWGAPAGTQTDARQPVTVPAEATVTVREGDSLWSIAREHLGSRASDRAVAAEWPRWWKRNRAAIGDDPSLIRPGQVLSAPERSAGK